MNQVYNECERVSSLLHSVFLFEENVVYNIRDLDTVKHSNIETSVAEAWLKKMINVRKGIKEIIVDDADLQAKLERLILKYFPLIKLYKNSKFKIKSSTFYNNEIQKIAFYLFQHHANNTDSAIVVPERFDAKCLMAGLDEYWQKSGSKWYLNKGAGKIIDQLIKKQRDMVTQEMEIIIFHIKG